jgi:hypothetical protein
LAVHILQVFQLIVRVFGEGQMLEIEDGRNSKTNLLNTHFKKNNSGKGLEWYHRPSHLQRRFLNVGIGQEMHGRSG